MEEKKFNALNDEALDQVTGGGIENETYRHTIVIGGYPIFRKDDLYFFCYFVLAKKEPWEIKKILLTSQEYGNDLVMKYEMGGLDKVYNYLDKHLRSGD